MDLKQTRIKGWTSINSTESCFMLSHLHVDNHPSIISV